ncbi:DsbA family oxidoreductase [Chthonobacter albigriseus]|uniref:DsbA family oxidoreductase n=1 Tax=Chthonobacter albigriseus TaxID=1683161 RepID=UPI0015EEF68E|nr:DsbA family oxidoreductase [Chthonobacter albigriseus]
MSTPLTLDVVIDVVCPWCYLGKRRLDAALETLPDFETSVRYRPFQLDPTIPPEGKERRAYMIEKFGDPGRVAEAHARLEEAAAGSGIAFAFERIEVSPNTLDAHRLIHWAQEDDLGDEMVDRLFALYFEEGADIGDREVLIKAAEDVGLDPDFIGRNLDDGTDREAIQQAIAYAGQLGITGVPCTIIAGKYAISGAQPSAVMADAIRQVSDELARAAGG